MSKIVTLCRALLKSWTRSRSGVFFGVLFPIMLLLIFGTIFGSQGGSNQYDLYVQNVDVLPRGSETNLSSTFLDVLNDTGLFNLKKVPPGVNAREFVEDQLGAFGGSFRILIIPAGFEEGLLNASLSSRLEVSISTAREFLERTGDALSPQQRLGMQIVLDQLDNYREGIAGGNVTLLYISDPSNTASQIVSGTLSSVAQAFNYGLIGAKSAVDIGSEHVTERKFKVVDYYVPGLIAAFIMTNGIIGVTTTTTEFKRRGVLKRFAVTPLRRIEWILGNVFTQTIISFLLVFVMIGVGWVIFGVTAIPNLAASVLVLAGAVLFSGMGLLLAGVITDVEASAAAGEAIAFPMMFLSGAFWPVDMMPKFLQIVAKALPLTYLSDGLRSALIFHHLPTTAANLAVVAVLAVLFILTGAAVTRWHEE